MCRWVDWPQWFAAFFIVSFIFLQSAFLFNLLTSIFVTEMASDKIDEKETIVANRPELNSALASESMLDVDALADSTVSALPTMLGSAPPRERPRGSERPRLTRNLAALENDARRRERATRPERATSVAGDIELRMQMVEHKLNGVENKLDVMLQILQAQAAGTGAAGAASGASAPSAAPSPSDAPAGAFAGGPVRVTRSACERYRNS